VNTGVARVREVAEHLSLHPETVRIMCRQDVFKGAFKVGTKKTSQIRIPWKSVYEYEQLAMRVAG
jgi:hypothetical protein